MFYTYYVKAEGKYYFGSRTPKFMLNKDAKDDFMIHYFTSTSDERLQEIIRNKEYEKAEIIKEYTDRQECLKDEELLIENFWWLYGRLNCWNHYADGKFSYAGLTHSEESKRKNSEAHKGEKHPMYGRRGEKHPLYGKTPSEETCKKISEANKGEKNPMYGKTHSEETIKKMSEANKGKYAGENNPMYGRRGEKHPMYGKTHSEETIKKMSEAKKGKPKQKFYWQTPEGEIRIMGARNAKIYHPDWIEIGPVED